MGRREIYATLLLLSRRAALTRELFEVQEWYEPTSISHKAPTLTWSGLCKPLSLCSCIYWFLMAKLAGIRCPRNQPGVLIVDGESCITSLRHLRKGQWDLLRSGKMLILYQSNKAIDRGDLNKRLLDALQKFPNHTSQPGYNLIPEMV